MYEGNNPTALQSKQAFEQALVRLMQEKDYKDINVRILCFEADMSRQTFYNLFCSIDEVLLSHLTAIYRTYFDSISENKVSIRSLIEGFAAFMRDHDQLISLMIRNGLTPVLQKAFQFGIAEVAVHYADAEHKDYGTAFLSGALTAMMIHWIQDSRRLSVDELTAFLEKIFEGNYYQLRQ